MALLLMGPLVERRVAGSAEEAVVVAAAEREVAFEVLESFNHCSACVAVVAAAAGELKWEWLLAAAVTFAAAVACCMIVDLGVASFETRVAPEAPLTGSFGPCPHRACEAGLASASH